MSCPICAWSPANSDFLLLGETPAWRICLAPNQTVEIAVRSARELSRESFQRQLKVRSLINTYGGYLRKAGQAAPDYAGR